MKEIILFTLLMCRLIPVIVLCPFLGGRSIISPIKIGLTILFSLILFPFIRISSYPELYFSNFCIILIALKEMFLGILIGLIAAMPFYAYEASGRLIDILRNVNIAEVLIPQMQEQASTFSNFNVQLGIIIFFLINGHHFFIEGLFNTFSIIPIYEISLLSKYQNLPDYLILMTGKLFVIALQISAPALIVILMIDLFMGLMNKITPQYNMFIFSLSLKGIIGIIFFLLAYEFIIEKMRYELTFAIHNLLSAFR